MTESLGRPTDSTSATSPSRRLHELAYYGGLGAVATALAVWVLGLTHRPWDVPLSYNGDGLFFGAAIKNTIQTGWYENNPDIGAPLGSVLHDFPQPDNTQYLFAKAIGLATQDWALAYNLTYLLTFPLAALTAAWFFRLVGTTRVTAFGFGVLYAFAPYHFMHGPPHLALSQYFALPLGVGLVVMVLTERPIWARRDKGSAFNPLTWLTSRSLATVAILVLLGTTSSYYTMFTLILLGFAIAVLALKRRGRALLGTAAAAITLAGALLANMAPDLYYAHARSTNVLAFARLPEESETYALKFAALVLPTHWSRFWGWGDWRLEFYSARFPLPAEHPALGLVAAFGFVFLVVILPLYVLAVSGTLAARRSAFWESQMVLSALTFVAFLFGTVGGLETLFAIFVTPNIRAWNRIVILIGLLALASTALWLDRLVLWARGRVRWPTAPRVVRVVATAVPCTLVVIVGLFDQVAPDDWAMSGTEEAQWTSDARYGADVQASVPTNGMVVQFPFMEYPEVPSIYEITDYDPLRGYLHTTDVHWTYGGVKGIARAAWTNGLADVPVPQMLVEATAAGAEGIHVDRFGYPGRDSSAFESALTAELGEAPLVSPDGRFAFFDLTDFRRRVTRGYEPETRALIGRRVLLRPEIYWQDEFAPPTLTPEGNVLRSLSDSPVLTVVNPARVPARMTISFLLRPESGTDTPVAVVWPDGVREDLIAPTTGLPVSRDVLLPPGVSTLSLWAPGVPAINVVDLKAEDMALAAALQEGRDPGLEVAQ